MKLRVFAVAWTVFTALAAPALLLAADEPAPPAAPVEPAAQPPPVEPAPPPAPEPAVSPPAPTPAAEPAPAPQPAADQPEPAAKAVDAVAKKPAKRKPVARAAASTTVTIRDFEFAPKTITVNVGDTVTWSNAGPTGHSATGSGFDTGILKKGASGSHTFTAAGSFAYICTPHPFMKGTVTVAAASSGSGGGSGGDEAAAGADDGPSLPNTGGDAWALALLGTGLLSLGLAVRRRSDSA